MKLNISLAQLAFEFGDIESNIARAAAQIAEAAGRGSDLVLLPELWASGYDLPNWARYATPLDEGVFARLSTLARQHSIAIGGSLLEADQGRAYNTLALIGSDGALWGSYRKIHLFRLLEEEKYLAAGDHLGLVEAPWGPTGLGICYDLRFPEMFRPYAVRGAKLVLVVAEWPVTRIAHWRALLKGRAIENQIFVAAVNKVGESQGVRLGGGSMIVDPWGEVCVEGDDREGLLTAEIDLRQADKARRFIPVFKDRREDIYRGVE